MRLVFDHSCRIAVDMSALTGREDPEEGEFQRAVFVTGIPLPAIRSHVLEGVSVQAF